MRPAYFRAAGGSWELLPHIRAAVRFRPANLADPLFLAAERPYDLILCRNVFIYLTPEAKQRAMAHLDRLLALDGRPVEHFEDVVGFVKLRAGERVLMSRPRVEVLRNTLLSHMIHHRGQLSVYLRLLDVPVPAIYGPSADEQAF